VVLCFFFVVVAFTRAWEAFDEASQQGGMRPMYEVVPSQGDAF
jgi:hypothetical protein